MKYTATTNALAKELSIDDEQLTVHLIDGRTISVPLEYYPTLVKATLKQRENYELVGGGYGVHWPDLDLDLSINGMLAGVPEQVVPNAVLQGISKRAADIQARRTKRA
jgi:hypothetical protein